MPARDVEHVSRLAQAGDMAAQALHQFAAAADIKAEMAGAAGEIGMMQVIWLDPHRDEPAE